ncbi:hypothetical protein ACSBR1_027277 [Camellia fascicularis]
MPVAASAKYFLNLHGDVLINRLYYNNIGGNMVNEAGQNESTFTDFTFYYLKFRASWAAHLGLISNTIELQFQVRDVRLILDRNSRRSKRVMLDTVGPKLQVFNKTEHPISLKEDSLVVLTPDQNKEATSNLLPINFGGLSNNSKMKKLTEHIHALAEKLQIAYNENAKLSEAERR